MAAALDWRVQLPRLWNLQRVDRQLDALRAEREALLQDEESVGYQRSLHADEAALAALQAEWDAVARRQRLLELEHKSQLAEQQRLTRLLYGGQVHSPRELTGLERNIAGVSQRVSDLETQILESMEQAEALANQRRQLQQRLQATRRRLEERQQVVRQRLGEVDRSLPELSVQREELARQVDVLALREYERLRTRPGGVAVARVHDGACGGCGVQLSALVRTRLRRPEGPVSCEHCGRLLWEESPERG